MTTMNNRPWMFQEASSDDALNKESLESGLPLKASQHRDELRTPVDARDRVLSIHDSDVDPPLLIQGVSPYLSDVVNDVFTLDEDETEESLQYQQANLKQLPKSPETSVIADKPGICASDSNGPSKKQNIFTQTDSSVIGSDSEDSDPSKSVKVEETERHNPLFQLFRHFINCCEKQANCDTSDQSKEGPKASEGKPPVSARRASLKRAADADVDADGEGLSERPRKKSSPDSNIWLTAATLVAPKITSLLESVYPTPERVEANHANKVVVRYTSKSGRPVEVDISI